MTPKNKANVANLIGHKYGLLTIIGKAPSRRKRETYVTAKCDCGVIKDYCLSAIVTGHTKSCRCLHKIRWMKLVTKHDLIKHPTYTIWTAMKQRCYDAAFIHFEDYGGRGIRVCNEWLNDFKAFYDWSMKNGWQEGLQIDRFPNNDGNYEPNNCRFATRKQQSRNKRSNVFLEFNEKRMCVSDWAIEVGIPASVLRRRIAYGWSIEKSLTKIDYRKTLSRTL